MQREINKALSAAIERFFGNQALYDALQQAQQVRVNTLGGSFFKNKFPEACCVEVQCCLRKLP